MQIIENISDKNYNKKVITKDNPFVLVFVSKTCPHCRTVEGFISKIENKYPEVNLYFIKSEDSPKLLKKFMVSGFPLTLFINKEKRVVHSVFGAGDASEFFNGFEKISEDNKKGIFSFLFGGRYEKNKVV